MAKHQQLQDGARQRLVGTWQTCVHWIGGGRLIGEKNASLYPPDNTHLLNNSEHKSSNQILNETKHSGNYQATMYGTFFLALPNQNSYCHICQKIIKS